MIGLTKKEKVKILLDLNLDASIETALEEAYALGWEEGNQDGYATAKDEFPKD